MKDIAVGAGRLHLVDVAGVGDLFAVRRERVLVLTAEPERRNVVRAGREVARNAAVGRHQEQVAVLAVEVVVPVAKHQLGEDLGLHLRLGLLFVALLVAGVVVAVGIDRRDEQDALAVGRPQCRRRLRSRCWSPCAARRSACRWRCRSPAPRSANRRLATTRTERACRRARSECDLRPRRRPVSDGAPRRR